MPRSDFRVTLFERFRMRTVSPTPIEDVPQKGSTPQFRISYVEDENFHLPPAIDLAQWVVLEKEIMGEVGIGLGAPVGISPCRYARGQRSSDSRVVWTWRA